MIISSYVYRTEGLPTTGYMHQEYAKYYKEWIDKGLKVGNRVALLYAGGPAIHHSDNRNVKDLADRSSIVVKSQLGYNVFNVAKWFDIDFEYVSINTNTCASSMYCLYEASKLITEGFTDVIIIAMDMQNNTQDLLFDQLGVSIRCASGLAGVHLKAEGIGVCVGKTVWKWNNDKSPMTVSIDGYKRVLDEFDSEFDWYKTHGTGTPSNNEAELGALPIDAKVVEYKSKIGHTQGASTLVEMCMMIEDENVHGKVLMLASGMGGFYGGAEVIKE